jgi:hypothetical protein
MTTLSVRDTAGRYRSPATMPGYHVGRSGCQRAFATRLIARVDGIIAVMRHPPTTVTGCLGLADEISRVDGARGRARLTA